MIPSSLIRNAGHEPVASHLKVLSASETTQSEPARRVRQVLAATSPYFYRYTRCVTGSNQNVSGRARGERRSETLRPHGLWGGSCACLRSGGCGSPSCPESPGKNPHGADSTGYGYPGRAVFDRYVMTPDSDLREAARRRAHHAHSQRAPGVTAARYPVRMSDASR
jgi:hypothetical protein